MILDDPNSEESLIYHATYTKAMALNTQGEVIWETPTGLRYDTVEEASNTHSWGLNYHPQTDSVIGITSDGFVFAMDRKSGANRNVLLQLPGTKTPPSEERPPKWILKAGDKATDDAFGKLPNGKSIFTTLIDAIFGGGGEITNYFGIDPNNGNIYIAATAPDEEDGEKDNLSKYGAIYQLTLTESAGNFSLEIKNYQAFEGGTGSTPSISADGSRIIVSDNSNNVIAFDADLNEIWRLNMGEQVAASVAISPDNNELYAVTQKNIFKIIDKGDSAELAWAATLDAWAATPDAWTSGVEFNALTPTITANGIVVSVGAGKQIGNLRLLQGVGMGILDRDTGKLRYFAPGREESISISSISPAGTICTANSPVRRALTVALQPKQVPPLVGGISCYKAIRLDLLARDAICAAKDRMVNLMQWHQDHIRAAEVDLHQIALLLDQAESALDTALERGEIAADAATEIKEQLVIIKSNINNSALSTATEILGDTCELFD